MSAPELTSTTPTEAGYRRFLRYYYLTHFWYDAIFAYAVYTLYFSVSGMSVFDISVLLTWWSVAALALEVPTGAWADCGSRTRLLVLGPLIKATCFVAWFFAGGHFFMFALGFTLWALGSSLRSGATEALLYDTLRHHGRREEYERVLGRKTLYVRVGGALATISGGLLATHSLRWVMLLSVVPLLFSAWAAARLEEPPKGESRRDTHFREHVRLALRELRQNRVLLCLTVYLWAISAFGALEEYEQLYFRLSGASGRGLRPGGLPHVRAQRARRLAGPPHDGPRLCPLWASPPQRGALGLRGARSPGLPGIAVYLLAGALVSPAIVLVESRIQHCITGESRATITSAVALLLEVPVYGAACGVVGRVWALQAIYLSGAILFVAFGALGPRDAEADGVRARPVPGATMRPTTIQNISRITSPPLERAGRYYQLSTINFHPTTSTSSSPPATPPRSCAPRGPGGVSPEGDW